MTSAEIQEEAEGAKEGEEKEEAKEEVQAVRLQGQNLEAVQQEMDLPDPLPTQEGVQQPALGLHVDQPDSTLGVPVFHTVLDSFRR